MRKALRAWFVIVLSGSTVVAAQAPTGEEAAPPERTLFPRETHVWPHAIGPHYGNVAPDLRRASGTLHTAVGSFRLGDGDLPLPPELKTSNRLGEIETQYFYLQLDAQRLDARGLQRIERLLEATGGAVVRRVPISTLLVRLTRKAHAALETLPAVTAIEPYHPAFKLAPYIGRLPQRDAAKAASPFYDLAIDVFPGEDPRAAARRLERLGATVEGIHGRTIRVSAHRASLPAIASLEAVERIDERLPVFTLSEETTTTIQTGNYLLGSIPFHDAGIDGSGNGVPGTAEQCLMVLDNGIQLDAGDLSDTRIDAGTPGMGHRKVEAYETTNAWGGTGDLIGCPIGLVTHGHAVAATALGHATDRLPVSYGAPWFAYDGELFWKLDGVAPGARLIAYDALDTSMTGPDGCLFGWLFPGTLYSAPSTGSLKDGYDKGARTFNLSFGSAGNAYTGDSTDIDEFLFDHPEAMLFAPSGNGGGDGVFDASGPDGFPDEGTLEGGPANAKNAVVVGASHNANDPDDAPNDRASVSGMGPAGRRGAHRTAADGARPRHLGGTRHALRVRLR